ncbi:hypothetical protein NE237_015548 [Protea cynaroides]|uniref:BHLH domain-containing protein n=1 Tax=Protea cynaroides TaxID=273540 RepID=A0A9Q0QR52_9MAGN|nr:hypothetical protein NE237_015548 [Protea cynaroides]
MILNKPWSIEVVVGMPDGQIFKGQLHSKKLARIFSTDISYCTFTTLSEVASDGDGEESDKDYHEDEKNQENDDLAVNEDIYDVSEEENMEDDDMYMANVDSEIEDDEVKESTDEEENGGTPCRIAHKCASDDCKWKIYAAVFCDGTTIQIRTMQAEHSCPRTSNNRFARSVRLTDKIGDKLRDDREKNVKAIMREVQRNYGIAMSRSQVYRAKKIAMALIDGNQDDQYRLLPSMANNPPEGLADDFFDQILAIPTYSGNESPLAGNEGNLAGTAAGASSMVLQLNSGEGSSHVRSAGGGGGYQGTTAMFPLGLSLEQGKTCFVKPEDASGSGKRFREGIDTKLPSVKNDRDSVQLTSLFPGFGHVQSHPVRPAARQIHQPFPSQPTQPTVPAAPHPPTIRPRVRARRGQATDPHSIAERLRRERIAERMKALQELVPSSNKTDRAAMLDEIVDYVKFLRLQVKVLSVSRLGGAGAVAQLVADIPLNSAEGEGSEGGSNQRAWEKWSNDGTERQVAKLMEEDVGAAMQFLQSKALCIMPTSLASAIYHTHEPDTSTLVKPESSTPS